MAACQNRLSEKAPSDVTKPYATIQLPTSIGSMGGGGYKPLAQVDGWCPADGYNNEEASVVVWRIVARARRVLETARNIPYQSMHYSARPVDLMALPDDVSRGDANPVAHAMTRAELTIHNI